ncbi:heat-shock transcription factor-1 [Globodera pallida]|nr:heat-shock transcription factor-1 [Globodera pallida]
MSYYQQPLKKQSIASYPESHQQQFTGSDKPPMTYKPCLLREDGEQKIPLFLIKLWNIVEDPSHWEVIRWDESGMSFHIMKPYVFCSDILPFYFKHKNLNSLVRQLNMYGFRKNTPIERSGLARAESDQDHLEFFHSFFRRDHPEMLINIHRKVQNSAKQQGQYHHPQQQLQVVANAPDAIAGAASMDMEREETVAMRAKDLTGIFDELRTLRERQKNMDMRMDELTKENEMLWNEMAHIRGTHLKQQQIVNKLIQFLVALVGPAAAAGKQQHRLGKKRHITTGRFPPATCASSSSTSAVPTATSFVPGTTMSTATDTAGASPATSNQLQSILPANATEILDRLISEIATSRGGANGVRLADGGVSTVLDRHNLGGIQIDDLSSSPSAVSNDDQQLASYVGGGGGDGFGAIPTIRPSRPDSGPIIAEVTEEFDELSAADPNGLFQLGTPRHSPSAVQQQQMQHHNYQSFVNGIVGQGQQQTKYAKKGINGAVYHQQHQQLPQQQQLVVYQPLQHSIQSYPQQRPEQQQMNVVPCQSPPATTIGHRANIASQPTRKQQQQPQQPPIFAQPNSHQQSQVIRNSPIAQPPVTGLRAHQQPTTTKQLQSPLTTPPTVQQDAPSLSEGMLLNEAEMADIAGLNAFLDENGSRFDSLTNSIGEHWVNGVDDDDLQLQDLFESVDGLASDREQNAADGTNGPSVWR